MIIMKAKIHPEYYQKTKVKCACGHVFTVGATKENLTVEICSNCHPFYTGTEKLIDVAGRVEKFRSRQERAVVHGERSRTAKKSTVKVRTPKAKTAAKKTPARTSKLKSKSAKPQRKA